MPVNASQFGAAANEAATPLANTSLFSFLAADSTNPATPDFKTIAASLFAVPTAATTVAPIETKSTAGAKSAGPFLPREREENNENNTQSSELPAAFLPTIPAYPVPTLTPQAPRHTESMPSAEPTQTKTDSLSPICTLPVVNQPQDLTKILASRSTNGVPEKVLPLQQYAKVNNAEPTQPAMPKVDFGKTANTDPDDKTTDVAQVDTKPAPAQVVTDHEITNVGQDEKSSVVEKAVVSAQLTTSAIPKFAIDKAQSLAKSTPYSGEIIHAAESEKVAPVATTNKIDTGLNTTEIDPSRAKAADFGQKPPSTIEKPAVSSENKKLAQTKQSAETAKETPADDTQPVATVEPDQTLQQSAPTTQSINDDIKAVIPHAVVLEHTVSESSLGRATNLHPMQLGKSAPKSNQEESTSVVPDTATLKASDTTYTEVLNSAKPTPVVESSSKSSTGKSKTDTTVKKTQRSSAENESDTTTANTPDRTETNAVNSAQGNISKNHDTVTPQVNPAPHAKSASARNTAETPDLTSPSTTQVPDIDGVTPPSHAGVNTAKLVQGLTQSELRVGLQTRDFGNIDIRTSASRHEFSAQISVEHSEVAHTLTAELPNLYARLNEQQVPVSNIQIHNQSLSTSSGLDQRSQQSAQQSQSNGFTKQQMEPALPSIHEVFTSADRLDIRV